MYDVRYAAGKQRTVRVEILLKICLLITIRTVSVYRGQTVFIF